MILWALTTITSSGFLPDTLLVAVCILGGRHIIRKKTTK